MLNSHEIEMLGIVNLIGEAYPNFNPTKKTISVYCELLKDIPTEELRAATLSCLAEAGRKFAPSVGEIRGKVIELRGYIANVPESFQALQEVTQKILEIGSYRTPEFSHPLIKQAVNALGWRHLCLSE